MHSHDSIAVSGTATLRVEDFYPAFPFTLSFRPRLTSKNLRAYLPGEVNMKRKSMQSMLFTVSWVAMISLVGCATESQNYLLTGAGLGGAAGAAIGAAANSSNPWKGAAIGGLLGGATGAVGGEVYRRTQQPAQPQQGYYQYGPQQPGYGYPPPNQGYNPGPYYDQQPSSGQSAQRPGY